MIRAERFIDELARNGFGLISGVPCSYLTPLINTVIDSDRLRYVGAANEGDAVAIAAGAELGGRHGVVMFQNSGFGNAVNPLTSLCDTLRLPVLVITTWRGHPNETDEPQHGQMGRLTPRLMETLEIPWEMFPTDEDQVPAVIARAVEHMRGERTAYGLIMRKGSVAPHDLRSRPDLAREFRLDAEPADAAAAEPADEAAAVRPDSRKPRRPPAERLDADTVLAAVQSATAASDVILATTGFTGRALFALEDRPSQLYMVGSMGCAASLGLGLALTRPERRIVVLDGDGALLMRMGGLATLGHERPSNLLHVLLDNAVHDSTGGQATVAPGVDFASVARACGYPVALRAEAIESLRGAVAHETGALTFVHVRTAPRADRKLPRPDLTPPQVARRLQEWLAITEIDRTRSSRAGSGRGEREQ